jgi:hypothetical protein
MLKPEDDIAVRLREKLQSSDSSDIWYDIVEMYSKTSLTKASKDHLIALSGIANEVRQKLIAASKPWPQSGPWAQVAVQYVSGLWFEDLHQGLLWQTRSSSAKACSCGAPSWSWLSRQGELRWLPRSSETRKAVQIKALRDSWSQLHEEADLRRWQELESFAKQSHTNFASIDPFSTISMTAGIILAGQMTPVLVQNLLESTKNPTRKLLSKGTVSTLARETDVQLQHHEAHDAWKGDTDWLYAAEWLLVCGLCTPKVIGGWALLDDPQYKQQLDSYEGAMLLALHTATRRKVGTTNVPFETRKNAIGRDVYEVLFLEPQEDNRYRRIGVGRIFDGQIIKDFAASEQMEIELV